jgi:hypothetical protein
MRKRFPRITQSKSLCSGSVTQKMPTARPRVFVLIRGHEISVNSGSTALMNGAGIKCKEQGLLHSSVKGFALYIRTVATIRP